VTAASGLATFSNLSYNKAETITIDFGSGSLSGTTSGNVSVSPASAARLAILTQPPATAVAGVAFSQQAQIRIEDQFGNLRVSDNSTIVTATRAAGSGTLQGNTSLNAAAGIVTFTNLAHTVATNITIAFTSGSLTSATSGTVAVSPAGAHHLAIQTQPSPTATAGVTFTQQPVIRVEDQFSNLRNGDNGTVITASRNAGSGALQGATSAAITSGVASFTNLSHNVATTLTIDFAASGLLGTTSSNVVVGPAVIASLAFVQQPGDSLAGAVISPAITVRAQDGFGNNLSGVSVSVALTTGTGSLNGTLTRPTDINGLATFDDLSLNVAGTKKLTATGGALSTGESAAFNISPGLATRLTLQTQPSSSAVAGVAANLIVIGKAGRSSNVENAGLGRSLPCLS